MTAPTLLYGRPDAEFLYADPAAVLERARDDGLIEVTVVEHTVHEPREHLTSPEHLLEYIAEHACEWSEVTEDWCEDLHTVIEASPVRAMADVLLQAIANRITYRMADKPISRTHYVLDDDGGDWKEVYRAEVSSS